MSKATRINASKDVIHTVRHGIKGVLLYLLPFPVLIAAIIALVQGSFWKTIILGGAFAGFMIAAIVARHGFRLEKAYIEKKIAKAPGTPYKTVAALILSVTTGVTAFLTANYGLFSSIVMGGATFLGFYLSYGLDPRKDKSGNFLGVSTEEVIDALEAAEIKLSALESARDKIRNLDIKQQLRNIINEGRLIIDNIEDDPKDLERARKFLTVHLDGAKRVTETYVKTHSKDATTDTQDTDFLRVLNSIEENFKEQRESLKQNDQFDLDVQIEVVETQIKQDRMPR